MAQPHDKTIIYTMQGCSYCDDAKNDLKQRGVEFEERDMTNNPELIELVAKVAGFRASPIIVHVGFGGYCIP